MITVNEADRILCSLRSNILSMRVPLPDSVGSVLSQPLVADRDFPPFDRAAMDGIAIRFVDLKQGMGSFPVVGLQAAGDAPVPVDVEGTAVEIMTGASVHGSLDTIIPYENLILENGVATIKDCSQVKRGHFIHIKGSDRIRGDVLVKEGTVVDPAVVSAAATVGAHVLEVYQQPRIALISSGSELTEINQLPDDVQLRRSNVYGIQAALRSLNMHADLYHLPDDRNVIYEQLQKMMSTYEVWVLSGGVSKGKMDFLPQVLNDLGIHMLFHGVAQRPGKPFWMGKGNMGPVVFAFPGNPVSTFMCTTRYLIPWLQSATGSRVSPLYCKLAEDVNFEPQLEYFLQVSAVVSDTGECIAHPTPGNGSGDLANLLNTNGFMQLPANESLFHAGRVYPVWLFKPLTIVERSFP